MAVNAESPRSSIGSKPVNRNLQLVAICFFLSGATGLIYEVVWARMLELVFGATTVAISAVLCAFMGGLALGSFAAARFSRRIPRAIRAYGIVEVGIGVYALATPVLFKFADWAYVGASQRFNLGAGFLRFTLAATVLLLPTILMGATLPILASKRWGRDGFDPVTLLYTWNVAGAIGGSLAAGFFLLPLFGVHRSIWIGATINLVIGFVALALDQAAAQGDRTALARVEDLGEERRVGRFWVAVAFGSGFGTIAMQIVWSRLLSMIIGSSIYAFSLVLGIFLAGLAIGAYLANLVHRRNWVGARNRLAIIEILIAASLFVSILVTNATPAILVNTGFRFGVDSWLGLLTLQVGAASMMILTPAMLMGMVLPSVLIWARTARLVGHSYALNTLGSITGSIIVAFILIPGTNTRFTIFCVTSICLILAGIAYEPGGKADRAVLRSLSIGVSLLLIVLTFVFWPRLNLNALSAGAYDSYIRVLARNRTGASENSNGLPQNHRLLMFAEGLTSTVSVRVDDGITSVAINGRTNGSDGEDMPTQIMLGQLGVLAAPRLDRGLVVGFLTGVTPGSILQSRVSSLDCLEIEEAAVRSSHFFEHVNKLPLQDSRLRVIIDDVRTHLRVGLQQYNFIVSEPSHPWVPGVANLFTREFFRLAGDRLKDDGVFVQWLQTYQLSTETMRSVLATFHNTFPYVAVFRVRGEGRGKDLILMGSRTAINFPRMDSRVSELSSELSRAGIQTHEDLWSWFVCDQTQLKRALNGAVINTDDNMYVESIAGREAFRASMEENSVWLDRLRTPPTF